MRQATLAWTAFQNMMRTAARDPLWALVALICLPFRIWKPLLGLIIILIAVTFTVGLGGRFALGQLGFGPGSIPYITLDLITLLVLAALVFRLITNPLIVHFGDMDGETHGSARFATPREISPLTRSENGLLIGRDPKSSKLMRYEGPAHLMTIAPTRTGKGVGTIIPNLLTTNRSLICIDPKGENAKIAGRARQQFGPVHVLDPFGATDEPSAAFNPLDRFDLSGLDFAEDASTPCRRHGE
ncbi:type IV secretory system conjugative DNA transfer family protein [Ochrobactrum pecoris]|nr:type IV secretory system conjugative DNA transfer family protein [Brucella pecoris]